jgi:hypothetical protein
MRGGAGSGRRGDRSAAPRHAAAPPTSTPRLRLQAQAPPPGRVDDLLGAFFGGPLTVRNLAVQLEARVRELAAADPAAAAAAVAAAAVAAQASPGVHGAAQAAAAAAAALASALEGRRDQGHAVPHAGAAAAPLGAVRGCPLSAAPTNHLSSAALGLLCVLPPCLLPAPRLPTPACSRPPLKAAAFY